MNLPVFEQGSSCCVWTTETGSNSSVIHQCPVSGPSFNPVLRDRSGVVAPCRRPLLSVVVLLGLEAAAETDAEGFARCENLSAPAVSQEQT